MPTLSNLVARRVAVEKRCPVCCEAEETVVHLFLGCAVTVQVLSDLRVPFSPSNNTEHWKWWLVKEFVSSVVDKCKMWVLIF